MVTAKITSVIERVEKLPDRFKLTLACGICMELSVVDAKDFVPATGMILVCELQNFIPAELVIDGKKIFSKNKTNIIYELRYLILQLKTEIQAEEIQQKRNEFLERKSDLAAIFQHRILLFQSFLGNRYSQNDWLDEVNAMKLAQEIYRSRRTAKRLTPLALYEWKQIQNKFSDSAKFSRETGEYALLLYNVLLEDERQGIRLDDFEQIKDKVSYSKVLRSETMKGDAPAIADIIRYQQSLNCRK